jgi:hypothetical protein
MILVFTLLAGGASNFILQIKLAPREQEGSKHFD